MEDRELIIRSLYVASVNGFRKYYADEGSLIFKDCIIFNPDFAKAFWKDAKEKSIFVGDYWLEKAVEDGGIDAAAYKEYYWIKIPGWQYHQRQLLIEIQEGRNPLKYLEKFL